MPENDPIRKRLEHDPLPTRLRPRVRGQDARPSLRPLRAPLVGAPTNGRLSMTKKHYEGIAETLALHRGEVESYPYARQTDGYAARDELDTCCHLLADYFAAENPCFDMRLFLGACGIEGY